MNCAYIRRYGTVRGHIQQHTRVNHMSGVSYPSLIDVVAYARHWVFCAVAAPPSPCFCLLVTQA